MIRLVAADMDGTLLDSNHRLPAGFDRDVRKLMDHGVCFVAASGRQYYNLLKVFEGYPPGMIFLCENGTLIMRDGQCLYANEIPYEKLVEPVRFARELGGVHPVLCGIESAWIESDDPELLEHASRYYEQLRRVDDVLEAARHDRICKIAIFDGRGSEAHSYQPLRRFEDRYMVTLSGECWVDLMNPGVNKGTAMAELQRLLGITPAETMAFGDYLNDCTLMERCEFSFAMANAHPELKRLCRFETLSNDAGGVRAALRNHFEFLSS